MPMFVIQQHTRDNHSHWDLMLEQENHLATWQVSENPLDWPKAPLNCRKLKDHRKEYLTYEGAVSGNRGSVKIAEKGDFTAKIITETRWRVRLAGKILRGDLELTQEESADSWRLTFVPGQSDRLLNQGDHS
jgi:hypothetical protein